MWTFFNPLSAPGSISVILLLLSVLINKEKKRKIKYYNFSTDYSTVPSFSWLIVTFYLQKYASPQRIKDTSSNFRQFVSMEKSESKAKFGVGTNKQQFYFLDFGELPIFILHLLNTRTILLNSYRSILLIHLHVLIWYHLHNTQILK